MLPQYWTSQLKIYAQDIGIGLQPMISTLISEFQLASNRQKKKEWQGTEAEADKRVGEVKNQLDRDRDGG